MALSDANDLPQLAGQSRSRLDMMSTAEGGVNAKQEWEWEVGMEGWNGWEIGHR